MGSISTLADLITQLENESEGSAELDWLVAGSPTCDDGAPNYNVWRYTQSLDAAMSLIPEGWGWALDYCYAEEPDVYVFHRPSGESHCCGVMPKPPALALVIACLRARMAETKEEHHG